MFWPVCAAGTGMVGKLTTIAIFGAKQQTQIAFHARVRPKYESLLGADIEMIVTFWAKLACKTDRC